eukprot:438213-Pelagomonas_calceolata.AAC.1
MVHVCPNNCFAVLDLEAAVCGPGLPICNFELEIWIGMIICRGKLFTFPYSGHNGVPCITDGVVPHISNKPLGWNILG